MKTIIESVLSFFQKKQSNNIEQPSLNDLEIPTCFASFKEQMQKDIIPRVATMIVKERTHLNTLKAQPQTEEVAEMIGVSEFQLQHFLKKHKEYVEYANNLQ
jgi:hypothetical protein